MTEASIKDVAKIAGVSIATVSRCINTPNLVRAPTFEKVQRAISATNYTPNTLARDFRRGKTKVILVVLPSVGDPFFQDIMVGIRKVAKNKGYNIIIHEHAGQQIGEQEFSELLVSRHTDGIVLLASVSPFATDIVTRKIPVVIGCEVVSSDLHGLPSVHIDNISASIEITQYLIDLGHKRIAFISGDQTNLLTADRQKGYERAMDMANLQINKGWVRSGHLNLSGAQTATKEVMHQHPQPTAIFCANDEMALGCIHELKSQGKRVPEDISVVGFDNIRYAQYSDPPLTTINQPAELIGQRTAERLLTEINQLGDSNSLQIELVHHELIVRKSAARPPKDN